MNANPACGYLEVPRSTGRHTMVTTRYADQQGSKSRQKDTKYATLQAMAPTNVKTVHQTSLHHIESNLDRLGLLSPTHDQHSQQQTGQIALQPVLINKSKFVKATHCTKIGKLKYRGLWWWKPWAGEAGARASIQPSKALCIPEKAPRIFPVRRSVWPS